MAPRSEIDALVKRVVAAVALFCLSNQSPTIRLLKDDELDRARTAHAWLAAKLNDRGKEALKDLEARPDSEDNKADLRKQILKFLEKDPASASLICDIIPESFDVESDASMISRVGSALNIASALIGTFDTTRHR